MITPERFGQGMTFEDYVSFTGTAENLAREAGWWLGPRRRNFSGLLREWYGRIRLSESQIAAIRWLTAQPGGPRRILVVSEEWSSDCRRDVPALARLAEAGSLELRIFTRDGQKVGRGPRAEPGESPNADIVNEFLNEKNGQTFQSVPVAVFYTRDFEVLHRYIEFPAIYHKERLADAMQARRPDETPDAAWARFMNDWHALQLSPFPRLWASAAIDEILSALHERLVVGPPA